MDELRVDVRFVAAEIVVESIADALAERGVIGTKTRVVDPSYLGLDFSVVADFATVLSTTLFADPVVPTLWHWLAMSGRRQRIIVETPIGRVVFDSRVDLTEDEVREKLKLLVGVL